MKENNSNVKSVKAHGLYSVTHKNMLLQMANC